MTEGCRTDHIQVLGGWNAESNRAIPTRNQLKIGADGIEGHGTATVDGDEEFGRQAVQVTGSDFDGLCQSERIEAVERIKTRQRRHGGEAVRDITLRFGEAFAFERCDTPFELVADEASEAWCFEARDFAAAFERHPAFAKAVVRAMCRRQCRTLQRMSEVMTLPMAGRLEAELLRLVLRVREGDLPAFEQLYQLTRADAARTLSQLVGNRVDVEDLLQETYLRHRDKGVD